MLRTRGASRQERGDRGSAGNGRGTRTTAGDGTTHDVSVNKGRGGRAIGTKRPRPRRWPPAETRRESRPNGPNRRRFTNRRELAANGALQARLPGEAPGPPAALAQTHRRNWTALMILGLRDLPTGAYGDTSRSESTPVRIATEVGSSAAQGRVSRVAEQPGAVVAHVRQRWRRGRPPRRADVAVGGSCRQGPGMHTRSLGRVSVPGQVRRICASRAR